MVSQEATIRSVGQKRYSWLFGLYGFLQSFDNRVDVDQYATGVKLVKEYDHQIGGFAFFHQSSISDFLVKNLTITGGIRADYESDALKYKYDREIRGMPVPVTDTMYKPLQSFEVMPKIALNYKIAGSNFYVVVARGYKTGGFNSTFERPEDLTFNPEDSWNYEAGSKFSFFRNRFFADIALFYIDWKNQQIYQTVPSGRGSMLKNAGHSASKGLEVTLRTLAGQGYELLLSYGYTHATFLSYTVNEEINYDGNYLPYVPRNTMAVQLSKTIAFKHNTWLDKMRFNILYRGAGQIYWNEENSHKQDFYGLLDAKISFTRKSFELGIWGSNLLDTNYEAFYFESLGNKYVQTGNPLHFGINLSINF
jgi:outer membrane receptor protein involved in Fe transport